MLFVLGVIAPNHVNNLQPTAHTSQVKHISATLLLIPTQATHLCLRISVHPRGSAPQAFDEFGTRLHFYTSCQEQPVLQTIPDVTAICEKAFSSTKSRRQKCIMCNTFDQQVHGAPAERSTKQMPMDPAAKCKEMGSPTKLQPVAWPTESSNQDPVVPPRRLDIAERSAKQMTLNSVAKCNAMAS